MSRIQNPLDTREHSGSHARKFQSWREVMDANEKTGHYWFTPDTMAFFESRLIGYPYQTPYTTRVYFVSGERGPGDGTRRYTVRVMDMETGHVDNVSEFQEYGTPADAIAARNAIVGYE